MGARLKPLHRTKHGGPGRWKGATGEAKASTQNQGGGGMARGGDHGEEARWNFLGGVYDFDALLGWVDVIFVNRWRN